MDIKLAFLGLIIAILAFSGLAEASQYSLDFEQISRSIVVTETIELEQEESFEVILPEDYGNLKVTGNHTQSENKLGFYDSQAAISYITQEFLHKQADGFYFVRTIAYPSDFDSVSVKLNLEKGVVVSNEEAYPKGYGINSDGESISLAWQTDYVSKGEKEAFFVNLEDVREKKSVLLAVFWWITGIAAVLALIYLTYRIISKIKKLEKIKAGIKRKPAVENKKEPEKASEKYEHLLDTEKRVIDLLRSADRNELWQKQIEVSTGYSKAKISRLVRNLEARGLISKIPFGNTNKVRLK